MTCAEPHRVLAGEEGSDQVPHMINDAIRAYVTSETAGPSKAATSDRLWSDLGPLYPVGAAHAEISADGRQPTPLDAGWFAYRLLDDARAAYATREVELSTPVMRELEYQVLLPVTDRLWREHVEHRDDEPGCRPWFTGGFSGGGSNLHRQKSKP